ncbi:hypothetical protein Dda_6300 [Drechslerella dactyloides]|uniref:Uncharacterized protein n=1 Tax=Drechslerella dactyloides TaxID=74499 RepID=A0AAD6IWT9_DREDA|nr:hypothetical protein Dda_6300 [Drechslerella dactyloides]
MHLVAVLPVLQNEEAMVNGFGGGLIFLVGPGRTVRLSAGQFVFLVLGHEHLSHGDPCKLSHDEAYTASLDGILQLRRSIQQDNIAERPRPE